VAAQVIGNDMAITIAGTQGMEGVTAYSASKAAVIGMTKSFGKDLAETGVLVNCIAPGPIRTDLVPDTPDLPGEPRVDYSAALPLRRSGEPEEVAPTAVFLASAASTYYCGQTLGPNGGDVML